MTTSDSAAPLLTTPLTSWHRENGARLTGFAGYDMPVQYSTIVSEHTATRAAAGLFDISHMGRLRFEGPNAHELLDHLMTRRISDMKIGDVRYSLMCNEEGGVLDDVLVSYLESPSGRQFFLVVVNASNRAKILKWLQPHLADFPDVACNDVTDSTAMISIQGPKSAEVLQKLLPTRALSLKYYKSCIAEQMGKSCIVSRTGYTGEDGYELIVRSEEATRIWENIMLAGRDYGIQPVGLGARDTLRLEAGMPLYGHELSESIDPITAGLQFAVNLKDRSFIGSESLSRIVANQPTMQRIGIRLEGRRAAREGAQLLDYDRRVVGEVTSGTFSPTLQVPIAMAYLPRSLAVVGTSIDVDIRGSQLSADIVALPFYRRTKGNGD